MVNVNAQDWLNKEYPINGTCQRNYGDKENSGKKIKDITKLDISKGKANDFLSIENRNLTGSLKLEGFTNLRTLIISSHELIELDVSECKSLVELDCQNNQLNSLNVNGCSNLKKINCSSNNLNELDLITCPNLEEVDINECLELAKDKIKSGLNYDRLSNALIKGRPQIASAGENDIRNIMIVGITGNGKSALSNTLVGIDKFKESSASTSATKGFQGSDIFEYQGKKYRLIDNIGFGDTNNITEEEILFKIGEGIYEAKEGINQILFVFKDRFSPEHMAVYKAFEKFISKSGIAEFTTLIRTNFRNFRTQQECDDDKSILLNQNRELGEIIKTCKGIIHVDNPPIPVIEAKDDDEEKSDKEREMRKSERMRGKSREKVLNHLSENCSEIYKLKGWDNINSMFDNYKKSGGLTKTEVAQGTKRELEASIREASIRIDTPVGFGFGFGFKQQN